MIEIITSFDQRYYDLIGKDCVSSFLEHWDSQFQLTCYVEGFVLPDHTRIKQIDFNLQVDAEYHALQKTLPMVCKLKSLVRKHSV